MPMLLFVYMAIWAFAVSNNTQRRRWWCGSRRNREVSSWLVVSVATDGVVLLLLFCCHRNVNFVLSDTSKASEIKLRYSLDLGMKCVRDMAQQCTFPAVSVFIVDSILPTLSSIPISANNTSNDNITYRFNITNSNVRYTCTVLLTFQHVQQTNGSQLVCHLVTISRLQEPWIQSVQRDGRGRKAEKRVVFPPIKKPRGGIAIDAIIGCLDAF